MNGMKDAHIHGLGATLAAMSLPETLVSIGERWVFAVCVAVSTTLVSTLASWLWKRVRKGES